MGRISYIGDGNVLNYNDQKLVDFEGVSLERCDKDEGISDVG